MKKIILLGLISLFLFLLWVSPSQAGVGHYFDIVVTANATQLENGSWRYDYTLTAGSPPHPGDILKEMSHWWIELPGHKIPTLSGFTPGGAETHFNENHGPNGFFTTLGNPFNGFHDGVKWDSSQLITYSFISTHGPKLDENGNFDTNAYSWFAKSGGAGFYDFGTTLGPNGGHIIPEPTSLSLLSVGLFGLFGFRKKKWAKR